jgi:hypothetical protein
MVAPEADLRRQFHEADWAAILTSDKFSNAAAHNYGRKPEGSRHKVTQPLSHTYYSGALSQGQQQFLAEMIRHEVELSGSALSRVAELLPAISPRSAAARKPSAPRAIVRVADHTDEAGQAAGRIINDLSASVYQ